ncbi:MAG: hypothetical protein HPY76_00235 [Anaerolineae bacterium]|jgi:hypothetical protein|nr:hypothetical protein [Anaerolineae bacterium]
MLIGRRLASATPPNRAVLFSILLSAYLISYMVILAKNIDIPYLWYDEAGQFWIAKGLNHDSDPLQDPGSLMDVIWNNAHYNMDPGGFGILLHFWTKLSNSYLWLRFLPFLFMFLTSETFIELAFQWTDNSLIAIAMGFLPLLHFEFLDMGFEIRAYSMEYLGVAIGIYSIFALSRKLSPGRLLLAGCIMGIFMTSRYAISVVYFFTGLYVLFLIIKDNANTAYRIRSLMAYVLPQCASLALSYIFALRIQNPGLEKMGYLPYLSENWRLLVSPTNHAGYLLAILVMAFILVLNQRIFHGVFHKYQPLLFVAVSSNFGFMILSFAGKYPWDPFLRGGQVYYILILLCVAAILGELFKLAFNLPEAAAAAVLISALALSMYLVRKNFTIRQTIDNSTTFFTCLESLDFSAYDRIFVDRLESPKVRYLFEYGELASQWDDAYPENFTFAKSLPHNQLLFNYHEVIEEQPYMNDLMTYDLLITTELYRRGQNDNWVALKDCDQLAFVPRSE